MWRRKATGVAALAVGAVLVIAGLIDHALAAPKAALCQSGIGQIGQAIDTTVAHDCGLVTALESAVGWLLAAGILAVILGVVAIYNSRTVPQPARPYPAPPQPAAPYPARPQPAPSQPAPSQPAAPWSAAPPAHWSAQPPSPQPPAPSPPGPASPPADRPWWTQT